MRRLITIGCCLVLAGSIVSGQGRPNVVFILAAMKGTGNSSASGMTIIFIQ